MTKSDSAFMVRRMVKNLFRKPRPKPQSLIEKFEAGLERDPTLSPEEKKRALYEAGRAILAAGEKL